MQFLSTPSARRATAGVKLEYQRDVFLSTPSARRATLYLRCLSRRFKISIHALREEGDGWRTTPARPQRYFYPRPPRGGRRDAARSAKAFYIFLSTPSARRATPRTRQGSCPLLYFYPRPPRGGRPQSLCSQDVPCRISIHALREEGDPGLKLGPNATEHFYPRPPRGGRRSDERKDDVITFISIHALREEGDLKSLSQGALSKISIHALREEGDLSLAGGSSSVRTFLSTPSARRATYFIREQFKAMEISIHALREEGDNLRQERYAFFFGISIHALREEGDLVTKRHGANTEYFYPRPPRGGRQQKQRKNPCFYSIINHSAQNGKNCNCAEHERCVFCGKNIRFSGAKKTEKA